MATLRDVNFSDNYIELDYTVLPSEYWWPPAAEWVAVDLAFKFGHAYPEIRIKSHGQEIDEVEWLTREIRSLSMDQISVINFEPMEPDYTLTIKHSGVGKYVKENSYDVYLMIDSKGAAGGVYYGRGPAMYMTVTREELRQFAGKIYTELYKIKRTLKQ